MARFEIAQFELRDGWYVFTKRPSGQKELIRRFKTEAQAKAWIARKSEAWLMSRSYADDKALKVPPARGWR
jgi:hypothetical protein